LQYIRIVYSVVGAGDVGMQPHTLAKILGQNWLNLVEFGRNLGKI